MSNISFRRLAVADRDSSPYQGQLKVLYSALDPKFTPVINMIAVNTCVQKPGELFDNYFARKLHVFNTHSGNELPADTTMDCVGAAVCTSTS